MKNMELNTNNNVFLAKWMAGEIDDSTLKTLVSNEDYIVFLKLKKGIDLYSKLEQPTKQSYKEVLKRINSNKKAKIKKLYTNWGMAIAASLLLFIGLNNFLLTSNISHKTTYGEVKEISLLDGSQVVLNSKSEITYTKKDWQNNRLLYLDGQAFFKVKKGSRFTVKTKNGNVTVLGTQFNVNANKDLLEVVCYTGKVKVTYNDKITILTPTKGILKIGNKHKEISTRVLKPEWILGKNTYKSIPLKYVLLDLEKQFNLKIDATQVNANILFTGSYNKNDQKLAFITVFEAMNLKYKETKNRIVLSKK